MGGWAWLVTEVLAPEMEFLPALSRSWSSRVSLKVLNFPYFLFSYQFIFLILWKHHTYKSFLITSTPLLYPSPLPPSGFPNTSPSQLHILIYLLFFMIPWVSLVLPITMWVWSCPLRHRLPTSRYPLKKKKKKPSFPQKPSIVVGSPVRGRTLAQNLSPTTAYFLTALMCAVSNGCSGSHVRQLCNVRKTAFPSSIALLLTLCLLQPLHHPAVPRSL